MESGYYQTAQSVQEYIKMAEGINGSALIKKLSAYLLPGAKILEIGSGPGNDFELLKKDFQVIGSDYSKEFLNRLNTLYSNETFLELNAITLKTTETFNAIYSNKVFQHLTNQEMETSLGRQSEILNNKGVICHSFWKGEGQEQFKGMLVNYQSEQSLEAMLSPKFNVLIMETYTEFEDGDSILCIAQKKG